MIERRSLLKSLLALAGWQEAPIACERIPCELHPCKEGEERCPLGHCQKPTVLYLGEYTNRVTPQPNEFLMYTSKIAEQHICTKCGIVYVPKEYK
jgi:hypothetical protein